MMPKHPSFLLAVVTACLLLCSAGYLLPAEIHDAIRAGDVARVNQLLDETQGLAMNQLIGTGATPLHLAAAENQSTIVGLLLARGAQLNVKNKNGFTPLHWAANRDAVDAARMLIQFGADVNAKAGNDITPLHYAAVKNSTNVIVELIRAGAQVDAKTKRGYTPLELAVMNDAEGAQILLAYKLASDQVAAETGAEKPGNDISTDVVTVVEDRLDDIEQAVEENIMTGGSVLPRPEYGYSLNVPLGFGEVLEFVWLKDMKIWVSKYEVTNGQYRRYDRKHNSLFRDDHTLNDPLQPVVNVSWNDADKFCAWLNKEYKGRLPLNCKVRLPASKEWMTFARCGDKRTYPWGDKWPPVYGNFCDLSARREFGSSRKGVKNYDDGFVVTCPVTKSWSNEWGIFGLAGNVWEWCEDWYDSEKERKVRHGGSWDFDGKDSIRIDFRGSDRPDVRDDTIGIRLVISKE